MGVGVVTWLVWSRALSWRLVARRRHGGGDRRHLAWPWYAAMERAVPGYLHYFFTERHVAGVTAATERHAGRPVWYYLPILVAGAWPWGLFGMPRRARPVAPRDDCSVRFLVDLLALSLAGSKLATYILPILPAIATLAAVTMTA